MINYDKIENLEQLEKKLEELVNKIEKLKKDKDSLNKDLIKELKSDCNEINMILNPTFAKSTDLEALKKTNKDWIILIKDALNKSNSRFYEIKEFDRKFNYIDDSYTGEFKSEIRHCIAIVASDIDIKSVSTMEIIDHEYSLDYLPNSDYVLYGTYIGDREEYLNQKEHFCIRAGIPGYVVQDMIDENFKENKSKIKTK